MLSLAFFFWWPVRHLHGGVSCKQSCFFHSSDIEVPEKHLDSTLPAREGNKPWQQQRWDSRGLRWGLRLISWSSTPVMKNESILVPAFLHTGAPSVLDSKFSMSFAKAECFGDLCCCQVWLKLGEEVSGRETRHQHHLKSQIPEGVSMLVN